MLEVMRLLNGDPTQERIGSLFDSLSKDTVASKNLSAANNTVLMLAAKLHATLFEARKDGTLCSSVKLLNSARIVG